MTMSRELAKLARGATEGLASAATTSSLVAYAMGVFATVAVYLEDASMSASSLISYINPREVGKWCKENDEPLMTEAEVMQMRRYIEHLVSNAKGA